MEQHNSFLLLFRNIDLNYMTRHTSNNKKKRPMEK
jgi:hypothetical protein